MRKIKHLEIKLGMALGSALLGYTACGQLSVSVGVEVPLPTVEIRAESDFYEPLTPYGRWEVVGSYGRCWVPRGVESDWRPYCNGNWQRTDAGWYWVSDEPWAWATYHYGRWNLSAQFGWYWVPQTQWAPAWVSWHSGGGYVGWAPMYPANVRVISPQAYVFVEERHFSEPVRRSKVIINNTTIINKTVNINNTKVVNNTVINEGPATAEIEKASGRKVQLVAVRELRHKEEAAVVAKQKAPASTVHKQVLPPVPGEAGSAEKKAVATQVPPPVTKPSTTPEPVASAPKHDGTQGAKQKPVLTTEEPAAKPGAIKEPNHQKAKKQPAKQENTVKPAEKKEQPPLGEKPAANGKNGMKPADKDHEDNVKEQSQGG